VDTPAISYPPAERSGDIETLHGAEVTDPYRWLEDIGNPKAAAWVAAQNDLTEKVLAGVGSRDLFAERLSQLWAIPAAGVPFQRGGRWFQRRSVGTAAQPGVIYAIEQPGGEGRVLLDPSTTSADGTVALAATSVSPDGSLLAYASGSTGCDWLTCRVREVESGRDLADNLERFYAAEWRPDSSGCTTRARLHRRRAKSAPSSVTRSCFTVSAAARTATRCFSGWTTAGNGRRSRSAPTAGT
jgi:prolyl oligopeptidase